MSKDLPKAQTGIEGFDEITQGGLPRGRPTLIVGGPGSGKTLLSMEFLVNGAMKYGEPGVFFSFEETEDELAQNVASLGFNIKALKEGNMLAIDHVKIEAAEIVETGDYDLEGLFVRLGYAIDSVKAKRVVLDTIESIFSTFGNTVILRSELRRLFRFLKEKGVTAVITGEKGENTLTRDGLEEYVSDAVIVLDNRVIGNIATRRMRIIKYRGSSHGSNEYPFLIDENGFSMLPVTSLGLDAKVTDERISTGILDLDAMLGGKGYFRSSTVLITGQAGTGKTSFGMEFVRAACESGKRSLFITFEESPDQVVRNMRAIGIELQPFVKRGLLRIRADRPTSYGLEMHLATIHKLVRDFRPDVVVIDPISSLMSIGEEAEIRSTLVRLADYLKMSGITSLFTDLKHAEQPRESSMISSLVDTWIFLESIESNGESDRILHLVKSRGMAHSNQIREFHITSKGIELIPPYVGPAGVFTGSARYAQEAKERAEEVIRAEEFDRLKAALEQQREVLESQIEAQRAEFANKEADLQRRIEAENRRKEAIESSRRHMRIMRTNSSKRGD
ncbi:MAG: circadian clock protein KaiC [Methanomassiliicoccus sp.]|nr:circadian clock protein KaiC [Methanomassiliicoccus sp.]